MNRKQVYLGCLCCLIPCLLALVLAGFLMFNYNLSTAIGGAEDNRPRPPTYEALATYFASHQREFNTLQKRIAADLHRRDRVQLHSVGEVSSPLDVQDLSYPPLADPAPYLFYFQRLGLHSIAADKSGIIELTAFSWGNLAEGSSCGYAYSAAKLTLQEQGTPSQGTRVEFTHLQGNWYLFSDEEW